jgi:hypothetical protein
MALFSDATKAAPNDDGCVLHASRDYFAGVPDDATDQATVSAD